MAVNHDPPNGRGTAAVGSESLMAHRTIMGRLCAIVPNWDQRQPVVNKAIQNLLV